MLKHSAPFKLPLFVIQLYDFHFVLSVLNERTERESEVFFRLVTEIDGIESPIGFVSVDLFLLRLLYVIILILLLPVSVMIVLV